MPLSSPTAEVVAADLKEALAAQAEDDASGLKAAIAMSESRRVQRQKESAQSVGPPYS
ncbi:hypothetical protein HOH45_06045 [bacterium]|nr:hypothetical protein [bacterium]